VETAGRPIADSVTSAAMEEPDRHGGERPDAPSERDTGTIPPGAPAGDVPTGPEAQALALEAAEIRRLVESGAKSPEAIRELAARMREHRAREEAMWRSEQRPTLKRESKGRLRGHTRPTPVDPAPSSSNPRWLALALIGLVLVVVMAANATIWFLVLPVVGLIAWAWLEGRGTTS
jgi:hypothetical protein